MDDRRQQHAARCMEAGAEVGRSTRKRRYLRWATDRLSIDEQPDQRLRLVAHFRLRWMSLSIFLRSLSGKFA